MKKFVVAALLATGASLVLPSCNNGAYDSDPNGSTGGLNPLDPNSGVTVYLGTMRATLNNTVTSFYPAYYKSIEGGDSIVGLRANDVPLKHAIAIQITNFKSMSEYSAEFKYSYIDTAQDTLRLLYYKGDMKVKLNGNEGGNWRGTFDGTLHRITPEENVNDQIYVTNGEFYVPKKTD